MPLAAGWYPHGVPPTFPRQGPEPPGPPFPLLPPPPLRSVTLPSAEPALSPAPALPSALAEELRGVVGAGAVITAPDRLLVYESDGLTQYRVSPSGVVLPGDADELRRVLRLLTGALLPFVMRGAGTGLSGGALALHGAVVVGTARMNRILEVEPGDRRARVEPGVVNAHLTRATLAHGLVFAPDPSSQSACTLGGNVAENSGGPHCLKYGVTSRYVTGLRVILPDGTEAELGGMGREEEGLDLVGLFVGSEGCFGAASEIEVSLVPRPRGVRTLLALFPTVESAGVAVTAIMARGLLPAALEIVDRETIRAVEASVFAAGYPTHVGAALVVEFDGLEAGLDEEAELAARLCRDSGAEEVRTAATEAERTALWQGRKKAFGAMGRIAPDLMVQDATVPRSRLPQVLAQIGEIGRRHGLRVANVFHAGDGNLHPNLLFDRRDPDELARVEAASGEIMEVCIAAGGTITGEHGVGVDKRRYMPRVYGPAVLERMGAVKEVFDPLGLCNPGKVLPDGYGPRWRGGGDAPPEAADRPASPGRRRQGTSVEALLARLDGELSPGGVETDGPVPRVLPRDEEEVATVLRLAAEDGIPIQPSGRDVESGVGSDSGRGVLLLGTDRLEGGVEHSPDDLQARVSAGVTLEELAATLAGRGQWLPLDPPGGGGVSVGGAVSTGVTGPLAAGYGRVRDQVLGLTLVDGTGTSLQLGGRVVKNVAGFDLVRLVTGSRGGLGVATSVTLRLFPLPARDRTLEWRVPHAADLGELRGRLLATGLPLASLEAVAERPEAGISTLARLQGSDEAVSAATRILEEAAGPWAQALEDDDSRSRWAAMNRSEAGGEILLRLGGLPSRGPERMGCLLPLLGGPGDGDETVGGAGAGVGSEEVRGNGALLLGLLDGRLRIRLPAGSRGERARAVVRAVGELQRADGARTSLRVVRWPIPEGSGGVGPPRAPGAAEGPRARTRRLEEELLRRFDPEGILPGRRNPGIWRHGWATPPGAGVSP